MVVNMTKTRILKIIGMCLSIGFITITMASAEYLVESDKAPFHKTGS
jgi:hypothetical protein